jgi:GGDEF domain-containing protein
MILLPHTAVQDALTVLEKLRALMAENDLPNIGKVTFNAGTAEWGPDLSFDRWLTQADDALYVAKGDGGNGVC